MKDENPLDDQSNVNQDGKMTLSIVPIHTQPLVINEITEFLQSVDPFIADEFEITTQEHSNQITDSIKYGKNYAKTINNNRLESTRPVDEFKKKIKNGVDQIMAPVMNAISILDKKLLTHLEKIRVEQEKSDRIARDKELARLQKEKDEIEEQAVINESDIALKDAIEKDVEIDDLKAKPIQKIRVATKTNFGAGSHIRETWDFEITDESKIPRMFMVVDETSIRAVVTRQKNKCKIDGIRVFSKKTVVTK